MNEFDPNVLDTVFRRMMNDITFQNEVPMVAPMETGFVDELGLTPQEAAYVALREPVWTDEEQEFLELVEAGAVDDPDRLNELLRELYSGQREVQPKSRKPKRVLGFKPTTDIEDGPLEPSSPVIREKSVAALPPIGQTGVKIDDEWWKKK